MSGEETLVHKVTLSTGKVVLLREIELKDEEIAAKNIGKKAGDSEIAAGLMMATEMLKLIIVKVDDKVLSATDRLSFNGILTYPEIVQARRVVQKLMGEMGAEPTVELEISGQQ
jgi:tRNA threonylcarbamoyladenosine modification (KEOPS) complex Cgi121 subunit